MSNQTVKAILKRYPEAVSAVDGVRVGDVLCSDVDKRLRVVNEGNISYFKFKHAAGGAFIIGNADRVAG